MFIVGLTLLPLPIKFIVGVPPGFDVTVNVCGVLGVPAFRVRVGVSFPLDERPGGYTDETNMFKIGIRYA